MKIEQIREILAPCGLNCQKCVAFKGGFIAEASSYLKDLLGNFKGYAERYSRSFPEYENYPSFSALLDYLSTPACDGCRNGHCLYHGCGVATCPRIDSKEIDYCYQCDEFPCEKPQFHPDLDRRWRERNSRMSEVGVEAYYHETKDEPRYV
ncbi:MAG: DUF3795 domain-containing protein [Candidatus Thorarchaeota archaeon]